MKPGILVKPGIMPSAENKVIERTQKRDREDVLSHESEQMLLGRGSQGNKDNPDTRTQYVLKPKTDNKSLDVAGYSQSPREI